MMREGVAHSGRFAAGFGMSPLHRAAVTIGRVFATQRAPVRGRPQRRRTMPIRGSIADTPIVTVAPGVRLPLRKIVTAPRSMRQARLIGKACVAGSARGRDCSRAAFMVMNDALGRESRLSGSGRGFGRSMPFALRPPVACSRVLQSLSVMRKDRSGVALTRMSAIKNSKTKKIFSGMPQVRRYLPSLSPVRRQRGGDLATVGAAGVMGGRHEMRVARSHKGTVVPWPADDQLADEGALKKSPGIGARPRDDVSPQGQFDRAFNDYMARLARLPPAGMTGFDARVSPAWAGLQVSG